MASTVKFYINTASVITPVWQECTSATPGKFTFTGVGGIGNAITAPATGYYRVADEFHLNETIDYECGKYQGGGTDTAYDSAVGWTLNKDDYIAIEITVQVESSAGKWTFWDTTGHTTTAYECLQDTDWDSTTQAWIRVVETASNVTLASDSDDSVPAPYSAQTDKTSTYQTYGTTNQITFTSAVGTLGNCNRIMCHALVPHNATNGTISWVGSYYNYYT